MFLFEKLLKLVITKTFPDVRILVYLHVSLPGVEGSEASDGSLLLVESDTQTGTIPCYSCCCWLSPRNCVFIVVCLFLFHFVFLLKVSVWFILKGDGDLRVMTAGSIPRRTDTWSQSLWNQRLGLFNYHCALCCLPLLTCLLTPHSVSSQLIMCRILNCHQIWSQDAQS